MSEENKVEETKENKKEEVARGSRGEIGTATAGLTIRQKWHEAHFQRVNAGLKSNPNKRVFVRVEGTPSLKQFARQLLKDGDPVAKQWFANKLGAKNQKRSDANIKAARETGQATKAAKRARAAKNQKKG